MNIQLCLSIEAGENYQIEYHTNMKTTRSILLVEDDSDDQEIFIQALRKIRQVTLFGIVNNAREAIEMLRDSLALPDLIFMDINMPMMSGLEYLSAVDQYPRLKKVPVIMLTSADNHREEALKLGAKGFIKKSGKERDFILELENTLDLVTQRSSNFTLR